MVSTRATPRKSPPARKRSKSPAPKARSSRKSPAAKAKPALKKKTPVKKTPAKKTPAKIPTKKTPTKRAKSPKRASASPPTAAKAVAKYDEPSCYLDRDALAGLDRYEYKGGAYTAVDRLLNPFWAWFAEQLPLWLAPNCVTLLGFLLLISVFALVAVYDPTLSGYGGPGAAAGYAYSAFCVLAYQTLDAADGKPARPC